MNKKAKGDLIIIGGHEDKLDEPVILEEVSRRAIEQKGAVVVVTAASQEPEEMARTYRKVFRDLGVEKIEVLDVRERTQAEDKVFLKKLDNASVVFFTGGDQLRITSQMAGTLLFDRMMELLSAGVTVAGTSAGAAVMPETMIIGGPSDQSHGLDTLSMGPGLGFVTGVVIDSHFAERGRMGRLVSAVAQNPGNLGLGIDEDTAVIIEGENAFRVIGSGAVYVLDGRELSYSSLSEEKIQGVLSAHNLRLHVLSSGDQFDLSGFAPIPPSASK